MVASAYTPAELAWLDANYRFGTIDYTVEAFEREFGRRPSARALQVKASRMGLKKDTHADERRRKAQKLMRWSDPRFERERAWMLEHDDGESVFATIEGFEAEFGIRLTRSQVSLFRAYHGTQKRKPHGGGKPNKPVGSERLGKDGYIMVKVREWPDRPQSKDNWAFKHHVIWEQANGCKLPEDKVVMFADRDKRNFDPDNLVAVDKKVVGIINSQGLDYWDAESLRVAAARARLMSAVRDAESGGPRECGVCGAVFEPTAEQARYPKPVQTCPACRALGKKAKGTPKRTYRRVCAVCHAEFDAPKVDQRRCPECIARCPKLGVRQQSQRERV